MSNAIGKILILVNLTFSVVLLAWAVYLFARPVDWGWQEPGKVWGKSPEGKKEPNERIASKVDERLAAYAKLREIRGPAVAAATAAEGRLAEVEGRFGWNHIYYEGRLNELLWGKGTKGKDGKEALEIYETAYNKDGTPVLQGGFAGVPKHDRLVPDATMPYVAYLAERDAKSKEVVDVLVEISKGLARHGELTTRLIGKDGKPGYYALREHEAQEQRKYAEELDHLRPVWVSELYNAQLMRGRRGLLEMRVIELGGDPSRVRLSVK
jgi:hypothetical protein